MQKKNVNFRDSINSNNDSNEKISVQLLVTGKVQGVYFRFNLQQIAKKNSVVGWVRNLPDGRVEALLEGNKDDVDKVIEWSQMGPENARVDDVKTDNLQYEGKFRDFVIQHDEP
jgi:acylphosphatase